MKFVDFEDIDLILEIGPGKGIITDALVKTGHKVVVIEVDNKLAEELRKRFSYTKNISVIRDDFLRYVFPREKFIIVSNIPFDITADIIRKITSDDSFMRAAYLILQKEAAFKFVGVPYASSPLLSHFLQINFEISYLVDIPRSNFTPRPKYDAAFISIKKRKPPIFDESGVGQFKDFLSYIFDRSRPKLKDALKSVFSDLQIKKIFSNLKLENGASLRQIPFDVWVNIYKTFAEYAPERSKYVVRGAHQKLVKNQSRIQKIHRTRKY
jgi:23S rRNA (adenine-N6)-dimethyltransferase